MFKYDDVTPAFPDLESYASNTNKENRNEIDSARRL